MVCLAQRRPAAIDERFYFCPNIWNYWGFEWQYGIVNRLLFDLLQNRVRTMSQSSVDIKLTQSVINKLAMRGIRSPCKVTVTVDKGLATLTGTVTQAHQKMAAAAVASGTSGIKRVVNQLVVKAAERGAR